MVVGAVGFLAVTSAQAPSGPRLSRKARLVDLIGREDDRTSALRRQVDTLQAELARLQGGAGGRRHDLDELRLRFDELAAQAGLTAVHGPGVTVELADSTMRESPSGDPNDLVVHEQDLQSVVNALWAAGAEAIAVNGERITATSAIRCVGNTLLLHGTVYAPPYRIAAIGNAATLEAGLRRDAGVERYAVAAEAFGLRFGVTRSDLLALPAFRGLTPVHVAEIA